MSETFLPSNEDAEQTILGSILLDEGLFEVVRKVLVDGDMYNPYNRRVYAAMDTLFADNRPINPISISEVWRAEGVDPSGLGGVSRVSDLATGIPFSKGKDLDDLLDRVKKHSAARQLIRTANAAISDLMQGQEDVKDIVERVESKIMNISTQIHVRDQKVDKAFSDMWEIVPDMKQQFVDYNLGTTNGVPTGWKEVDDMLDGGGLQEGGLYVLAAGEKTGKTSLALDWVSNISIIQALGWSAIVTGEMAKVTMAKRLYSPYEQIPYWQFRPGMHEDTYSKALRGLERFGKARITIADKLFSVGQISRHLRRKVEAGHKDPSKKIVLGVIDYLQLIELDAGSGRVSRTEEVEKVSRAFKLLASELGIPLIAISSLNRIGLTEGQVPDTFNLRQAGTIAFDAEAIWFLHNPAYVPGQPYTPMDVTPMNLILSRQRNGPTGTTPVMFIGPYMQFMTIPDFERFRGQSEGNVPTKSTIQEKKEQEDLFDFFPDVE